MLEAPSRARRLLDQWEAATEAGELSTFAAINGAFWLGMAMAAKGRRSKQVDCRCRRCTVTPARVEEGFGQKERQ